MEEPVEDVKADKEEEKVEEEAPAEDAQEEPVEELDKEGERVEEVKKVEAVPEKFDLAKHLEQKKKKPILPVVTEENAAASKKAEEAKEQWKRDNPLKTRMQNIAKKAAAGSSTGMGLAGLGAQIANAVKNNKTGKVSVNQVVKEI